MKGQSLQSTTKHKCHVKTKLEHQCIKTLSQLFLRQSCCQFYIFGFKPKALMCSISSLLFPIGLSWSVCKKKNIYIYILSYNPLKDAISHLKLQINQQNFFFGWIRKTLLNDQLSWTNQKSQKASDPLNK